MKKLINQPHRVVEEMTEGFLALHAGLARLSHHSVLLRSDANEIRDRQVALISGGGSGHEPAHAGYIGEGMLTAAVAGEVFTSPSADSVFAAIKAVGGKPGVLLIVKNYTGDRLNFGLAAERARAQGIEVKTVIVADDVALAGTEKHAGRRGIAGTVFVHKIAGAAAAEGKSLAEVASIAQATAEAAATMGVSLSACTVPALGKPSFTLNEAEIELGLGIHGEPGVCRIPLASADQLADRLVESILSTHSLDSGARIALLVNNLGATTTMELAIVARRASLTLASRNFTVERAYAGTFMSSLDMAGVSISILRIDDERLRFLDAPTSAPAWLNTPKKRPEPIEKRIIASEVSTAVRVEHRAHSQIGESMQRAIEAICLALFEAEPRLTELDRAVGDGDLGINLARGAAAIQTALPTYALDDPAEALKALALTLQEVLGGSSGPLYGVLLFRAASSLSSRTSRDPESWAEAAIQACEAVSELGGAQPGDRTMLDALLPFARSFEGTLKEGLPSSDALEFAVREAETAAQATAQMTPRRGRSSYLGKRALGTPDPGAVAVAIWLRALATSLAAA